MKELMQPIDRLSGKYRHLVKNRNIKLIFSLPLSNKLNYLAIPFLLTYELRQ